MNILNTIKDTVSNFSDSYSHIICVQCLKFSFESNKPFPSFGWKSEAKTGKCMVHSCMHIICMRWPTWQLHDKSSWKFVFSRWWDASRLVSRDNISRMSNHAKFRENQSNSWIVAHGPRQHKRRCMAHAPRFCGFYSISQWWNRISEFCWKHLV